MVIKIVSDVAGARFELYCVGTHYSMNIMGTMHCRCVQLPSVVSQGWSSRERSSTYEHAAMLHIDRTSDKT